PGDIIGERAHIPPVSGRRRQGTARAGPARALGRCVSRLIERCQQPWGDRMTERHELIDATDETIEDAVRFADPMILRGLLYQLTGDASVAATEVHGRVLGLAEAMVLANHSDADLLQSKAADFLKSYRDSGADDIPIG